MRRRRYTALPLSADIVPGYGAHERFHETAGVVARLPRTFASLIAEVLAEPDEDVLEHLFLFGLVVDLVAEPRIQFALHHRRCG